MESRIPHKDHIIRYIAPSKLDEEGNVTGSGFIARLRDENCVSYNWFEFFTNLSDDERIVKIRELSRITYAANGLLVKLNVGIVLKELESKLCKTDISVIHAPLPETDKFEADPSHALMTNIPDESSPEAEAIGDIIAQCVLRRYPAK